MRSPKICIRHRNSHKFWPKIPRHMKASKTLLLFFTFTCAWMSWLCGGVCFCVLCILKNGVLCCVVCCSVLGCNAACVTEYCICFGCVVYVQGDVPCHVLSSVCAWVCPGVLCMCKEMCLVTCWVQYVLECARMGCGNVLGCVVHKGRYFLECVRKGA